MVRSGRVIRAAKALTDTARYREIWACAAASKQWPRILMGYVGATKLSYPYRFEFNNGDTLILDTFHDLVTLWVIFFRNEYVVEPNDRRIIDVGANIGAFTLYAARLAPRATIIALEPFPSTFERLDRTLVLNRLKERVLPMQTALSAQSGYRAMDDSPGPSQSRGLLQPEASGGMAVSSLSLEDLLDAQGFNEVDLVKLDIEGGEHEVVLSATPDALRRIRRIVLEYHPNRPKFPLFQKIKDAGFSMVSDVPVGPDSGVASFAQVSC